MNCERCGKKMKVISPPIEDYLDCKFIINFFEWKLALIRDLPDYDCENCLSGDFDEQEKKRLDEYAMSVIDDLVNRGKIEFK